MVCIFSVIEVHSSIYVYLRCAFSYIHMLYIWFVFSTSLRFVLCIVYKYMCIWFAFSKSSRCILRYMYIYGAHSHIYICYFYGAYSLRLGGTGWRRLIGSPKLQIIFHKRATKYRSLLRKMTYKDKGSYESSPPCTICMYSMK